MVSIIMPAYNSERYIKDSIQSVIAQSYIDWELIIIDDCSTDRTLQIIEFYEKSNEKIHCYKNDINLGVAESRNQGILLSSGEWIAFLDSDDCWHPEKLEMQMKFAEDNQAEFLFTGSSFINEKNQTLDYYLPAPKVIEFHELLKQNVISCSSVLIRKELVQQYPMKNAARMHEDFAVWLQILRECHICAYGIDKPLLLYRISMGSKSGNKIKAAIMTYRVYRYIGIPLVPACYYWLCYSARSLKKYRNLIK